MRRIKNTEIDFAEVDFGEIDFGEMDITFVYVYDKAITLFFFSLGLRIPNRNDTRKRYQPRVYSQ